MSDRSPRPAVGQRCLVPLADYAAPPMPTEHAIRRYWRLLRLRLQPQSADPMRTGERLQPATRKLLDAIAAPPAWGPLMDELQLEAQAWQEAAPKECAWLRALVVAPCDHDDLVGSWAEQYGHQVLRPPPRAALCGTGAQTDLLALPGQGLLVVPQLERWFLRERDGLATVRTLLEALGQLERPCLVSCNSWAWAFLEKAAGAALVLPTALTFEALRAKQLHAWFAGLASRQAQAGATLWYGALGALPLPPAALSGESTSCGMPAPLEKRQADALASAAVDVQTHAGAGQPLVFRLSSTGADVLRGPAAAAEGGDAAPTLSHKHQDAYLQRLASRSLGIPWVAWNMWRDGLRDANDIDQVPGNDPDTLQNDGRTLWVSDLPEFSLPPGYERAALLVAHALLVHGGLTRSQLQAVLPSQEQPGVLSALHSAGFVEWCSAPGAAQAQGLRDSLKPQAGRMGADAEVRVRACAYPALRAALKTAGFPTGAI